MKKIAVAETGAALVADACSAKHVNVLSPVDVTEADSEVLFNFNPTENTEGTGVIPLNNGERKALCDYELTIEKGLETFFEVGSALMAISERKLYRETHTTFADYCLQKWRISRSQAYRLIDASKVMKNLSPIGDTVPLPSNEAQSRPLSVLPLEQQTEAWLEAVNSAEDGVVSAKHVATAVEKIKASGKSPVFEKYEDGEIAYWKWEPVSRTDSDFTPESMGEEVSDGEPEREYLLDEKKLTIPTGIKIPKDSELQPIARNVMVCPGLDIFAEDVSMELLERVIGVVRENKEWNFLFVTGNPPRLSSIEWPENAWVGVRVSTQGEIDEAESAMEDVQAEVKWILLEPFSSTVAFSRGDTFRWIVLSGGVHQALSKPVKSSSVESVIHHARENGWSVFIRGNLWYRPLEFPSVEKLNVESEVGSDE